MDAHSSVSPEPSQSVTAQTLLPEADRSLAQAIATLQNGDFNARWDAVKQISRCGTAAIAPLLKLLQISDDAEDHVEDHVEDHADESDQELAWFIARTLGEINDPSVIPALMDLIQATDNPEVAQVAATALTGFGEAAIAPLQKLLTITELRLLAVRSLAQIHHPAIVPPLLSIVQDQNVDVRSAAIAALSQWNDPQILTVLVEAVTDRVATVRQAAIAGLGFWATAHPLVDQVIGQKVTDQIQPRLWDLNREVCGQAAKALGRIGSERAIAALAEGLQSQGIQSVEPSVSLKVEIVRALGWSGSIAALDQLQQYLAQQQNRTLILLAEDGTDPVLTICQEIILVLGRIEASASQVKAAEILVHLLQSNHPITQAVRSKQAIAQSLGQLRQDIALDPLIQLLADEEMSVRFQAIAALKQLKGEAVKQRLIALNTDVNLPTNLREGVAIALQEWGS
jgi:HEAT repeat protein